MMKTAAMARAALVAVGLMLVLPGCGLMQAGREAWKASIDAFEPTADHGYRDPTEETEDQWAFVGKEGRGDKPLQPGGDPLYSPKARSIERNLGFE